MDKIDEKVNQITRLYRAFRSQGHESRPMHGEFLDQIFAESSNTDNTGQNLNHSEARYSIVDLYSTYQAIRDPHREDSLATVMTAVRQYTESKRVMQKSVYETGSSTKSSVLNSFYRACFSSISNLVLSLSLSHRRTAAVFTIVLCISLTIPYLLDEEKIDASLKVRVSSQLLLHSETLAKHIQPPLSAGFAFSGGNTGDTTENILQQRLAFRQGIAAIDLPLLLRANQFEKLTLLVRDIYRLAEMSDDQAQMNAIRQMQKSLNTPDRENKLRAIDSYSANIRGYWQADKFGVIYELGYWVEAGLLATELPENSRKRQLDLLLPEIQILGKQISKQHVAQSLTSSLADRINSFPNKYPESTRAQRRLQRNLQHIKAMLL